MKRARHLGAAAAALLAISCATAPLPGQVEGPARAEQKGSKPVPVSIDVLQDDDQAGYALLSGVRFPAPIETVEASSTRDEAWFAASNVTDDRLSSAWAPGACEDLPSLTFRLAQAVTIDELALKLSLGRASSPANHRVFVDVWTSDDGGATWTPAASDLNPAETVLSSFAFPGRVADAVRLEFNAPGEDLCDLLVCYANFIDPATSWPSVAPTGVPSWTPTTTPSNGASWTPSTTPSPIASSTPYDGGCGTFNTFSQGGWGQRYGGSGAPAQFRDAYWSQLAVGGQLVVGTGRTLTFTSAEAVANYLTEGGGAGVLNASYVDPTGATGGGGLASQLVAMKLNLRRSDIVRPGAASQLADLTIEDGPFTGLTIGAFAALAERALGGDGTVLTAERTLSAFHAQAAEVNMFFHDPGEAPNGTNFTCSSGNQ